MKTVIDLSIPKSWQELPDKELRYVFRLLNGSFTITQVKARCLLRWAGMRVLRQEGALFVIRYKKQVFAISALQITEAISNLEWLGDFPSVPVRLSRIGFHRAVRADLQNVTFEDFLTLDNLYQGYLQTQKADLLHDMALILYQARFIRLTKEEATCIFYWFTSVKRYFASLFTNFFSSATDGEAFSPSYKQLQDNVNTQIRALTGGDITKEREVLRMDCWRALTELDAKAKDYDELKKVTKS
ncbi:MAG: hypothetical protein IKQ37_11875 [Bacteroidaceae bacterium]|nr:hypothetical protein [Bacteroidaceae bacterium]